jgi:subtilisin family serine protease
VEDIKKMTRKMRENFLSMFGSPSPKRRGRMAIGAIAFLIIFTQIMTPFLETPAATAQTPLATSKSLESLKLDNPVEAIDNKISSGLSNASGRVEVVVRLSGQAAALSSNRKAQAASNSSQQDGVLASIQTIDPTARVLGRTRITLNAVILEVNAASLSQIAKDSRIQAINAVVNYELELSETVPYIGATQAVQNAAARGAGVKVAVLDSGIDYTHSAFGGAGTTAAYQAAYGTSTGDPKNTTRDGLFPTARVVNGYDFVGETWPNGPLTPDEDPIDCGAGGLLTPGACAGGHGTHVADIIGGATGVAPEVDLYAVKVCSAVSTSCSGVAILQGIDWAADPNGDGDTGDRVDIINMSLGSPYGQNYDEDSAIAVDNATAIGILTVASAGNSSDKPYISGTPGGARTALSVAQTEVPSSRLQILTLNSSAVSNVSIGGVFQPWSTPLSGVLSGPVQYGNGAGGNTLGCSAFPPGSLTGKIVLVDRGTCGFSIKIANISAGGAKAGIIALIDTSLPFTGGFTNPSPPINIPGYMIRLADGAAIKAQIANGATITLDPNNQTSVKGTVVGSSSRGPIMGQMYYGNSIQYGQIIKPDIGAPGASISAIAGSGANTEAFGGTSGAAPMVAGSAALLKNVNPFLSPQEQKAVLMNNGETEIYNTPAIFGGNLAPITRIGGGEVRINKAVDFKAAAWEQDNRVGSLSFGMVDVTGTTTLKRTVVVRNYSNRSINYNITPSFRFADDQANGAVSVSAPASITIPRNSSRNFTVTLTIDGSKLRNWGLNGGSLGASGDALTFFEYDGYVKLDNANVTNTINLPWQVLPRKAANVTGPTSAKLNTPVNYSNSGKATAGVDYYSWIGNNPFDQSTGFAGIGNPFNPLKNVGFATFSGVGVCPSNTYILSFATNQFRRNTTPQTPHQIRINLDTDRDGVFDFQVRAADFTLNNLTDGRNLAWVVNLRTGAANAFFFTDHGTNSANTVLTICGSQLADATRPASLGGPLPVPALGQLVNARAETYDNYFTGVVTSYIDGMVFAPGGEKYFANIGDIPAGGSSSMTVISSGVNLPTTEMGLLLMLDGARGSVKNGNPNGKEAITVKVNP